MKKQLLTFSALLMVGYVHAQSYTFAADIATYQELSDRSKEDTVLNDYYEFDPNIGITLFGKSSSGTLAAGASSGYLVAGNTTFGYALDPMLGARFRKITSSSRLNVAIVANGPDSELVVQWKNMGFIGHGDNEFINCQVRISKATGVITYHYGPSSYLRTINDSAFSEPQNTGPEVLLVKLNSSFSTVYEFNTVAGTPQAPYFTSKFQRMTGIPLENQRFVFTPTSAVGLSSVNPVPQSAKVYPNPVAGNTLFVEASLPVTSIRAKNILGQLITVNITGLNTQKPEIILGQTVQPLFLEITLANGETIIQKINRDSE